MWRDLIVRPILYGVPSLDQAPVPKQVLFCRSLNLEQIRRTASLLVTQEGPLAIPITDRPILWIFTICLPRLVLRSNLSTRDHYRLILLPSILTLNGNPSRMYHQSGICNPMQAMASLEHVPTHLDFPTSIPVSYRIQRGCLGPLDRDSRGVPRLVVTGRKLHLDPQGLHVHPRR